MQQSVDDYDPFSHVSPLNQPSSLPTVYCNDDFYCSSSSLAIFRWIAIGWVALLCSTICIIFNLIFLSGLANRALRSTPTIYLTGIIIADTLRQALYAVIHVLPALPTNEKDQSIFYHSNIAFVVPQLVPLIETFTTFVDLSLLGCMCVLIRSTNLKKGDTQAPSDSASLRNFGFQNGLSKPSRLHRPRRTVLITLGLIAALLNVPMFFKFKLLETTEIKGLDHRTRTMFGKVIQTSLYLNRKQSIELYFVVRNVCVWIATMICFWLVWRDTRNPSRVNQPTPGQDWSNSLLPSALRLDRRRMEILMTSYFAVLWLLSSLTEILERVFLISYIHGESTWLFASHPKLGSWAIAVSEFSVVYLAVLRSISYVIAGVYVRRLLKNIYKHYVFPVRRRSLTHLSDLYVSNRMAGTRIWDPANCVLQVQGPKLSCSASLIPLMFSNKSQSVLEDHLHRVASRVHSEHIHTPESSSSTGTVHSKY